MVVAIVGYHLSYSFLAKNFDPKNRMCKLEFTVHLILDTIN